MAKVKTNIFTQLQWAVEAAGKYRQGLLSLQKRALTVPGWPVHFDVADEHREALALWEQTRDAVRQLDPALDGVVWQCRVPVVAISFCSDIKDTIRLTEAFIKGLGEGLNKVLIGAKKRPICSKKYRARSAEPRPPTPKQVEAVQVVGECKGNFAEAGRMLGRDPKTIRQHFYTALKKLGRSAPTKKMLMQLRKDRRGQVAIAKEDDKKLNL